MAQGRIHSSKSVFTFQMPIDFQNSQNMGIGAAIQSDWVQRKGAWDAIVTMDYVAVVC